MATERCVLMSIPVELLDEAGIDADGVVQMYIADGKLVMTSLDENELDELEELFRHDGRSIAECGDAHLHGGNCGECCMRCTRFGVFCDGCEKGDARK